MGWDGNGRRTTACSGREQESGNPDMWAAMSKVRDAQAQAQVPQRRNASKEAKAKGQARRGRGQPSSSLLGFSLGPTKRRLHHARVPVPGPVPQSPCPVLASYVLRRPSDGRAQLEHGHIAMQQLCDLQWHYCTSYQSASLSSGQKSTCSALLDFSLVIWGLLSCPYFLVPSSAYFLSFLDLQP